MFDKFFNRLGRDADGQPTPDGAEAEARFIAVNNFENQLIAAAFDAARHGAFNAALLDATIFAATSDLMRGTIDVSAGDRLRLRAVPAPDGRSAAALFSSRERLVERFGGAAPFMAMRGEQLFDLVADSGAVLNPDLAFSVHWSPEDIATMLGRPVRQEQREDAQILLGMPARPPRALVDGLRDHLGVDPRIESAWLALARRRDRDEASWFLDIRAQIDRDDLRRLLEPLLRTVNMEGKPLRMVLGDPDGEPGTGIQLLP